MLFAENQDQAGKVEPLPLILGSLHSNVERSRKVRCSRTGLYSQPLGGRGKKTATNRAAIRDKHNNDSSQKSRLETGSGSESLPSKCEILHSAHELQLRIFSDFLSDPPVMKLHKSFFFIISVSLFYPSAIIILRPSHNMDSYLKKNKQKQRKSGLETQLNCKTCFSK